MDVRDQLALHGLLYEPRRVDDEPARGEAGGCLSGSEAEDEPARVRELVAAFPCGQEV